MDITVDDPSTELSALCEPVIRALPGWFVTGEAMHRHLLEDTDRLPTLVARLDGQAAGFLCLARHSPYSAEIHVMGVREDLQRIGLGRRLVEQAEAVLRRDGVEYLQVKTLSDAHPDRHYAATRLFYLALGFRPLEEFDELWGAQEPCVQMVKYIG
jgi:GNAT superfamily N-acetyltransferase